MPVYPAAAAPSSPAFEGAEPAAELQLIGLGPGRFALRARRAIELSARAQLERQSEAAGFEPVALAHGYRLTESCQKAAPAAGCVTLGAGEVLVPAAWDGAACAGPCCPPSSPSAVGHERLPQGSYRLIVSGCGASRKRWASPGFELPATQNALFRARAGTHLESATLARLNATDAEATTLPSSGRIAGVSEVPGTEVALASAQVEQRS